MKKYYNVMKTTFNDALQYSSSILFRFVGFAVIMSVMISLWNFLYSNPDSLINGYSFNQMIWYILLAEIITFGSGSKVATDEIRDTIKSGNIAYQVTKPYNFIIYTICKYFADTIIRFLIFLIVAVIFGLVFVGPIEGFSLLTLIPAIPIFLLAVLIFGMVRILISLSAFWVEDSQPFQIVYHKIILIFGVLFPIEMFPKVIQTIIKFTPVYGVSYGPAKLIIDFNFDILISVLTSQIITIIIVSILIAIIFERGLKKLNVNGG